MFIPLFVYRYKSTNNPNIVVRFNWFLAEPTRFCFRLGGSKYRYKSTNNPNIVRFDWFLLNLPGFALD